MSLPGGIPGFQKGGWGEAGREGEVGNWDPQIGELTLLEY